MFSGATESQSAQVWMETSATAAIIAAMKWVGTTMINSRRIQRKHGARVPQASQSRLVNQHLRLRGLKSKREPRAPQATQRRTLTQDQHRRSVVHGRSSKDDSQARMRSRNSWLIFP